MSPRRLTPLLLLAFAFCDRGLSEADLFCEEAAERIRVCCGFRPVGLDCEDQPVGCDSPDLWAGNSRCIGSQPCGVLFDTGYCRFAQAAYSDPPATYLPEEPRLCR